jgi:multicomponent K+:H+ antiporter subunit F
VNVTILGWALAVAQVLLGMAMLLSTYRLMRGPRAQDRVASLDSLYANAMLLMVVFGIRTGTTLYFEAALIVALVGFASSSALAKFLMRGEVIE